MTSFTRGPLPARVYWTRRLLVVALGLLLVVGIARLLGAGSDGSSGPDRAAQVAAESTASPSAGATTGTPATPGSTAPSPAKQRPGRAGKAPAPVLAEPQGTCTEEDIAVSPRTRTAVAGPHGEVRIALDLRTLTSEACTWQVSARTLTVKITSGEDDIWSSRQCPRAVPRADVVVRRDVTTTVDLAWNGRRADQGCGAQSAWALPGTYHVSAAALAGEPADEQFVLEAPARPVITLAPRPTPEPGRSRRDRAGTGGAPEPSPSASR
jgi:hypothetical protein